MTNNVSISAEYYARYNLGNDVPFEPYTNGIVSYIEVSSASRGAYRPTWELLYAHYAQIKGLDAPWTEQYRNYTVKSMGGFEGGAGSWGEGSGHYDGLGWGSLLYHLDDDDVAALSHNASSISTTATTAAASSSDAATFASSGMPPSFTTAISLTSVHIPPSTVSSSAINVSWNISASANSLAATTTNAVALPATSEIPNVLESNLPAVHTVYEYVYGCNY